MSGVTKRDQKSGSNEEESTELRRGPWTLEEDSLLIHYIARHGEGRWNMLAKSAGLKRNGKSCRLRWLNYLKPDIKRGNLTPQEQLLILELHSRWGNRWSKIAQHLPGRTDNEIKNYWRTRVQKQARQLNIESGSKKFMEAVRCFWMPRLIQKVEQKQDDSSLTSTNLQVPSEPPNDSAFPSLSPIPSPLQSQDHYIPSNFPSDPLQFSQPLELSTEIPSTSHSLTPTCWFDQNSVDYYSNQVQDGWCVNYSSNGYGLMEGVNQEAMSGIESYDASQFDYSQNAESDQWVFGNMGDFLWNMNSM